MKQKNKPKNTGEKSVLYRSKPVAFDLSLRTVYGIFLSVSILIAGLLYGASAHTANIKINFSQAPVRQTIQQKNIHKLVDGYPIEEMEPFITKQNKVTAAFLISIAKKESNWGKRVPLTETGDNCYNYWGYKGAGSRGVAMGHGCFGSPKEAVAVVGKRINTFVQEYHFTTPEKLIVWKCGWNCDTHSQKSVKKWISDVGYYFDKIIN